MIVREEDPNHGKASLVDKLVEVLLAAGEDRLVEDKLEEHLHLGEDLQEDRLATLGKEVLKKIEK